METKIELIKLLDSVNHQSMPLERGMVIIDIMKMYTESSLLHNEMYRAAILQKTKDWERDLTKLFEEYELPYEKKKEFQGYVQTVRLYV